MTSIKNKGVPSSWKVADVRYSPSRTVAEPTTDSADSYWVPTKFESTGEEKLGFELKSGRVSAGVDDIPMTIQLDGLAEDRIAVREMCRHLTFALRRKELPVAKYGFGPFGVSNDLYFGHTFWDMDVWVLPTALFLAPDAAKSMTQYRLERADQAQRNFQEFARANGKSPNPAGMMFPWESSVTGREVCIAKTKLQHHVSGDVVWGLTQAEAMGHVSSAQVATVAQGVKAFYDFRSIKTPRGTEIHDVTSPNEKFTGNNDLYTNLLAEWIANNRTWKEKPSYYLPKDEKSFLNYDNDPLRDYQQAAGLLSIYPLQYPEAEKQASVMMARFEGGLSPNGPAMGHSIAATIWARLGQKRKAYQAWKQSWTPYLTGPNQLFSERKNVARAYFYTGAAGALNTVIYGFAGFRIDRTPLAGSKWSKKLKSGWWLSCKPSVPEEIGKLNFNRIDIDGQKYNFEMSSSGGFSVKLEG